MKRKPDHPDELVYRLRWAPGNIDGHNFGNRLAHGTAKPEDRIWELIITDDRYRAWTEINTRVPTVFVSCHMLRYGPEISATNGSDLHTWMKFHALPGQNHGLELPDPFFVLAEDYKDFVPTNGFVHPSAPQFGL